MTDYEKLIKEARTLEGMYYDEDKIVQGIAFSSKDEYYIVIRNIYGNNIFEVDWNTDIEDILNTLEDFKKQCYKPLTKVFTYHPFHEAHNFATYHVYSCRFLKTISEVEVMHTDEDNITPIEKIHEEIRRILNQKKDSKK